MQNSRALSQTDLWPILRSRLAVSTLGVACMVLIGACNGSGTRKPLPDWSKGFDPNTIQDAGVPVLTGDGAVLTENVPEAFSIEIPSGTSYPIRLHRRGSTMPCEIKPNPSASQNEIDCIMEMDELDLWVLGLKYNVAVPPGMCDFVELQFYMYENFLIGVGPDKVSYTIDKNGNYSDEVNSFQGEPQCQYDYSQQIDEAPNCCTGSYTLTVKHAESGSESSKVGYWGGESRLGDCYGGGAYRCEGGGINKDGFPVGVIYYTDRNAFRKTVFCDGLSKEFPKDNRPLANYYDPANHNGAPTALRAPYATTGYMATCLDDAEEIIARLNLYVREWNEEVEFDKGDDKGNPDTTGTEPDWMTPINDLIDWGDVAGNPDDYPRILRPGIGG